MLKVFITVKSLGKRKNYLDRLAWQLTEPPSTLRSLIIDIVSENVRQFNERKSDVPFVSFLTKDDIELQGVNGKVGNGSLDNDRKADEEEAVSTALLAFEDGLYRVFINGSEAEHLEMPLMLQGGDELAFIRFTMLARSMW